MPDTSDATPRKSLRIRPWGEIADTLDGILDRVVSRRVRIDESSRLRQYVTLMREEGAAQPAQERLEQMSKVRSDADEIVSAVEHLSMPPEVDGWETLFKRIQGGPLTTTGAAHDDARAIQVELLAAGMLRSAGARVMFEEPDVRAEYLGRVVSLAAKRPVSFKNLEKLVKNGRDQLVKAGGTGVLFLDLAELAPEHSQVRTVADHNAVTNDIAPLLLKSLDRLGAKIPTWVQGRNARPNNVLAYVGLLRARFVIPTASGPHYGTMRRLRAMQASDVIVPGWLRNLINATAQVNQEPAS